MADHPQVTVAHDGRAVALDERIAPLLLRLWRAGVATEYSCQGEPGSVAVEDLAYISFPTTADFGRFAARVPQDRPHWHSKSDPLPGGDRWAVYFPADDLPLVAAMFGAPAGIPVAAV